MSEIPEIALSTIQISSENAKKRIKIYHDINNVLWKNYYTEIANVAISEINKLMEDNYDVIYYNPSEYLDLGVFNLVSKSLEPKGWKILPVRTYTYIIGKYEITPII